MLILFTAKSKPHSLNNLSHNNSRYVMAGLKNKLKQLTLQKSEITKIRRKGENEYKKVKSLSRKYSSSLKSTQKRIETFKQNIEDINEMISQKLPKWKVFRDSN